MSTDCKECGERAVDCFCELREAIAACEYIPWERVTITKEEALKLFPDKFEDES